MSLHRHAVKRDANEPEIIAALRAAGVAMFTTDEIDIIAGRQGVNYFLEVKLPGYRESALKPRQRDLRDKWPGQYAIVTTAEEALRAVGL